MPLPEPSSMHASSRPERARSQSESSYHVTGYEAVLISFIVCIHLQRLTCLEIATVELQAPDEDSPILQPLQALTRLEDLRMDGFYGEDTPVLAATLSGMPLGSDWGRWCRCFRPRACM
jgi:hypothetical protein